MHTYKEVHSAETKVMFASEHLMLLYAISPAEEKDKRCEEKQRAKIGKNAGASAKYFRKTIACNLFPECCSLSQIFQHQLS